MAPQNILSCSVAIFLVLVSHVAYATDPNQLQDFCVGVNEPKHAVFINGKYCKDPMKVTSDDFLFRGLHLVRSTNNRVGSNVTRVNEAAYPGLNTLGISMSRIDFAPYGLNPPHIHPRGTEVQTVLEGTLYVGFVTTDKKFFTKVLTKGDIFIFPQGLIHFEFNIGKTPAVSYVTFSSQNPGTLTIADSMFGSEPRIAVDVLSKTFQLDPKIVKYLQSKF